MEVDHLHGLADLIEDDDENSTIKMSTCEGNAMAISKISVSESSHGSEDKGMMAIQGVGCFGISKSIIASTQLPAMWCLWMWQSDW